jgi:hypothetical protein
MQLLPNFKPGVPNLHREFPPSLCHPDFNRIFGHLRIHHQVIPAVLHNLFTYPKNILSLETAVVAQI